MDISFLFFIYKVKQMEIICCQLMQRIFLRHIVRDNVQFF